MTRDSERGPRESGLPNAEDVYRLCIFAWDGVARAPDAFRRELSQERGPDADLSIARFKRALRTAPGSVGSRWAAPPERIVRGVRLYVEHEDSLDRVVEIERIARSYGLAVLDEEVNEVTVCCRLGARATIEEAARALCATGSGYLLVEGGSGDRYFAQAFAERGSRELRLESVGNRALGRRWWLSRAAVAELLRRGWCPPRGSQHNFSRTLRVSPAAPAAIASALRDALIVSGLADDSSVAICLSCDG